MLTSQVSESNPSPEKASQSVRSSNFVFYDSVWRTMKTCKGVTAISQRFYRDPYKSGQGNTKGRNFYSALVDIVAQDGLEWVKTYSTEEKRLIYDMAKAGLVWGSDSDDSGIEDISDDADDGEGLLKVAQSLLKASKASVNRIRYKHPKIRIVLPRIKRGSSKDIDRLLRKITAMGITLQTAEELQPPPMLSDCLNHIPVDRLQGFTDALNLDCTMLITIVSDMSHAQVPKADWHHKNVVRQIELEKEELLLPTTLWPIFSSRQLLCTTVAAEKLEEIVGIIGTETEKMRTKLLMDTSSELTREQRVSEFQKLSTYEVPKEWQIPISVVNIDIQSAFGSLPKSAEILSKSLSTINTSVFFYGWISGNTTITTNGLAAKEIERVIEANRSSEEEIGPDIWLFPSPRSLIGKERVRNDKTGYWKLGGVRK